jgi:hypothetical protein
LTLYCSRADLFKLPDANSLESIILAIFERVAFRKRNNLFFDSIEDES